MLCLTCPIRSACIRSCPELKQHLKSMGPGMFRSLKTPEQLEKIQTTIARFNYLWEQREDNVLEFKAKGVTRSPNEAKELVHELMQSLSFRQRECITLRFWEELSTREIASRMGINHSTVVGHLKAAFAVLKREYQTISLKTPNHSAMGEKTHFSTKALSITYQPESPLSEVCV